MRSTKHAPNGGQSQSLGTYSLIHDMRSMRLPRARTPPSGHPWIDPPRAAFGPSVCRKIPCSTIRVPNACGRVQYL